jgi:DNA-binding response OmpR family regulator
VPLRAKEFELLARLAAQFAVTVSRDTLLSDVCDERWVGSAKTLDVHVAALRRRLSAVADGAVAPRIATSRGHRNKLDVPPSTRPPWLLILPTHCLYDGCIEAAGQ